MKRVRLLLPLLSVLPLCGNAQQHITYNYDALGNRTERAIVLSRTAAKKQGNGTSIAASDAFSDIAMRIMTTDSPYSLSIMLSKKPQKECKYSICDLDGVTLNSGPITQTSTIVDMSSCQPGIHILKIWYGNEAKSWKVLKKQS